MTTRIIPQDIIACIVEELSDDPTALRQCSTVSQSFLTPCRKILFSEIFLTYYPEWQYHCYRLVDVLLDCPEIQSYIRVLRVDAIELAIIDRPFLLLLEMIAVQGVLRVFIFGMMSHCAVWALDPDAHVLLDVSRFRDVVALPSLHAVRVMYSCDAFSALDLGTSPGLKHLHLFEIGECNCGGRTTPSRLQNPLLPNLASTPLETLGLSSTSTSRLVEAQAQLDFSVNLSQLRTLYLCDFMKGITGSAWEVMKAAASTLETMVWISPWDSPVQRELQEEEDDNPDGYLGGEPGLEFGIDLHMLPKLRRLEFFISRPDEIPAMMHQLMNCNGPLDLEELVIVLETQQFDGQENILNFIDETFLLAGLKLADPAPSRILHRLKKVEVRVLLEFPTVISEELLQVYLLQSFPSWSAAGILSGSVGGSADYDKVLNSSYCGNFL